MARVGQAFRQAAALDRAAAELCKCGHTRGEHKELPRELGFEIRDGAIAEIPNPAYEPFVFHCSRAGCGCKIDRRG